jgi:hypothetical protein
LEAATRQPNGNPLYDVYRVSEGPIPGKLAEGVTLDGPLAFLGYQVNENGVHSGETLELRTFWEVKEVPERPLSLMAHLIGPDGVPIAVGDGLGVSADQWQRGDMIVQRHRLVVPDGTLAGEYQLETGGYWLDTMERWSVYLGDGSTRDHLLLDKITVLD